MNRFIRIFLIGPDFKAFPVDLAEKSTAFGVNFENSLMIFDLPYVCSISL